MEKLLDACARGLKLHLSSDELDLADPRLEPAFALAHERRHPVVVHGGPEVGSTGAAVLDLCQRWPDLRLVLAHCGLSDLGRLHRHVTDVPNLFFDTSWWTPAHLMALFRRGVGQWRVAVRLAEQPPAGGPGGRAGDELDVQVDDREADHRGHRDPAEPVERHQLLTDSLDVDTAARRRASSGGGAPRETPVEHLRGPVAGPAGRARGPGCPRRPRAGPRCRPGRLVRGSSFSSGRGGGVQRSSTTACSARAQRERRRRGRSRSAWASEVVAQRGQPDGVALGGQAERRRASRRTASAVRSASRPAPSRSASSPGRSPVHAPVTWQRQSSARCRPGPGEPVTTGGASSRS